MAKLSHTDSRRMYSWWWDSHISPKNSKWLQENLTGMDAKVKAMIKLIEEDADSFARRAEMYYKKRPELMKMVEEFYRAYRSLAERYDHATGVLRHAHRTMTEAFPNQAPLIFADDSLANSVPETETRTPELSTPVRTLGEADDMGKKASKLFNDPFGSVVRVRKGLNFDEAVHNNPVNAKDIKLSEPDQECESVEIIILKEGLAKLEAEKEAGLVSYQQSLDRLSQLESEITQTREDFQVLSNNATKAENEVVVLKEALTKLENEKESTLQEYQRCLDRIAELQNIISTSEEDAWKFKERAFSAETESQSLKGQLDEVTVEKDAALNQYMQSLEMISNLEGKLRLTDEDASRLKERAEIAERDIKTLKQTISKLTEEKEAADLQYQKCLETISSLEHKLTCGQEEAKRLNVEIDSGVSKLKDTEEKCLVLERSNLSLHSELDSLMLKMGTQDQELTDKQKELGRLWACMQEQRLRFVEAETSFQTLRHLHAQIQEEVRSMASELQNRAQLLNVAEIHNQGLENEVLRSKEENKHLDELNATYAFSIKDLRNEISSLKESRGTLVEEVDLRLDQRNALQQEIYCLKEELNDVNMKHRTVLDEVLRVGLNPESLGSSVKELQDENFNLKETCRRESSEKAALLEKLKILEQLLVKNSILETSLSDLKVELKAVRGKIEALEQSCKSLLEEKSTLLDEKATLMTQVQETNKNLEKLSENNNVLVNLLSDARFQLEAFKAKSKILEDSCKLLVNEKAGLITEKDGLAFRLENTQIRLEDLRKIYGELESRCITLEEEKELTSHKVEELQKDLEIERQERTDYIQMNEARFSVVEAERLRLHEECQWRRRELDQMLGKAVGNEIEIFVLRMTAQEMEENNCTLLIKNQKFLEESSLSEKRISELEQHKFEQGVETKSLSDKVISLRAGTCQLLKVLDIVENHAFRDKTEEDKIYANMLLSKLEKMKESLCAAETENQQWTIELSALITWIRLQRLEAQNLEEEKNIIEHEFKFRAEQILVLQTEVLEILEMNEKLWSKLRDGYCNKEALILQIEDLNRELIHMQSTCQLLHIEKLEISEEKICLMNNYLQLVENKHVLEEENDALCGKVLALDNFSLIFRSCADEKFTALRELSDNLNRLCDMNAALAEKLSLTEETLERSKTETCHLKERLQRSENELRVIVTAKDQLINEIQSGKTMLHQMEIDLQEAEQKISLVEKEKISLDKTVEDLRVEYGDVKKVRDFQQIQILKLSADNNNLIRENNCLLEARQMFDRELYELHGENSKIKRQEDTLHIDLQKKNNEINNLETGAASIFGQLQHSMVSQLLYEQKFHELHEACLGYINQNEDLKTQLAAFGPEIVSLKECILSLENHTDLHVKFQNPEIEDAQGAQVTNDPTGSDQSEDKKTLMADTFYDLRDLCARIQAIEKAAVQIKELMVQENVDLRFKLDASKRQAELLKSESGRYRRSWKPTSEISEADNTLLTKDIVLDQISDGSSYCFSKREPVDMDNQIIELWETSDPDGTIGLTVGKSKKVGSPLTHNKSDFHRVKSMKKQKDEFTTSGTQIEKELSVDKLEISKRYPEPLQEGNKRKILERLDSDVQKLANLQITVQDLKRKLEVTEKGKRGKAVIECESLKTQLAEADMAIMKLFDLNSRLTKSIENSTLKSSADPVGDGSSRRRRIPEQARRISEKIGRLQLEVQKLQFALLKLDDEKEGKTKMFETKRRVLLRDYLYGAGRTTVQRQKKAQFCACVHPPASSD